VENYTPGSYWSLLEKERIEAEGEGGGRMEEGVVDVKKEEG
jgi:hypothetical protein